MLNHRGSFFTGNLAARSGPITVRRRTAAMVRQRRRRAGAGARRPWRGRGLGAVARAQWGGGEGTGGMEHVRGRA